MNNKDNDTRIIVNGLKRMKLKVKFCLHSNDSTIIEEDEKYGDNSYITLNKIREAINPQKGDNLIDFFYCKIINSGLLAEINSLTLINAFLPFNLKTEEKETNYRLCSFKEMSKKQFVFFNFNYFTINMNFQAFSFTVKQINFYINSKVHEVFPNEKDKVKGEYKLQVLLPLNYIDEKQKDMHITYYIITGDQTEIREKIVALSITDIERRPNRLLNSEINIRDSFFCRLTTQIYTCNRLDEAIIKMIYEHQIKYVLFDKDHCKDEREFMARLNNQMNKPYEIISFVLSLDNKATFHKKIDYFVKDKIDNILIYDYYSLHNLKNFDIEEQCEYLNNNFTPKGPAFNTSTNGFEVIENCAYEQID